MKRPIEEDYRYPVTGDETAVDFAEYSSDLEIYIDHLEADDNKIIHNVVQRNINYWKDLDSITTDLLDGHLHKDMNKLKHAVMCLQVLKGK